MVGIVAVKALVVVAMALIVGKTVVFSISLVGATKTAVVDETVAMNLEAIALVVTKTLLIVVEVVVDVAKALLLADALVTIAMLLMMMMVHLVVENMALLIAVSMPMVVPLDPGLISSGTGCRLWGYASLLEHLR